MIVEILVAILLGVTAGTFTGVVQSSSGLILHFLPFFVKRITRAVQDI